MQKTVKRRLYDLENTNTGGGVYIVHLDPEDSLYKFSWQGWVMNEKEFKAFEKSLSDDDYLMLITKRNEDTDD